MNKVIYGVLLLPTILIFCVCLWLPFAVTEKTVTASLVIAGALVTLATMASIAFAVVIYLESSVLKSRLDAGEARMQLIQSQYSNKMAEVHTRYYALSLASFRGLTDAFMATQDIDLFQACLHHLKLAEVDIKLLRGTMESLLEAVELALHSSKRRFLEIEPDVWSASGSLAEAERESVRSKYLTLKSLLLDSIDRPSDANATSESTA